MRAFVSRFLPGCGAEPVIELRVRRQYGGRCEWRQSPDVPDDQRDAEDAGVRDDAVIWLQKTNRKVYEGTFAW